jgi:hypothetical protein
MAAVADNYGVVTATSEMLEKSSCMTDGIHSVAALPRIVTKLPADSTCRRVLAFLIFLFPGALQVEMQKVWRRVDFL